MSDAQADEMISTTIEYECDECGQVFDTQFEARDHVKDAHLEKPEK